MNRQRRLSVTLFLAVLTIGAGAAVIIVFRYLSREEAVMGGYAVAGLLAALLLYLLIGEPETTTPDHTSLRTTRLVVTIACLTVTATITSGRQVVVPVGLAVGLVVLNVSLRSFPDPRHYLLQLVSLFAVSPVVKLVYVGFYIGGGDIPGHVHSVNSLLAAHSITGLDVTGYRFYPGLHLIVGAVRVATGLATHDALLLTGLIVFSVGLLFIYLLSNEVLENRWLSLSVATVVALTSVYSYYTSYFFPQSLATILAVATGYAYFRLIHCRQRRWVVLVIALLVALSFTHHLTHILIAPLVVVWGTVSLLIRWYRNGSNAINGQSMVIVVSVGSLNLFHWAFFGGAFLQRLLFSITRILFGGIRGADKNIETIMLGSISPQSSVIDGLAWLVGPYGIHQALLLSIFIIAFVSVRQHLSMKPVAYGVVIAGLLSAAVIFKTPISIKSIIRLKLAWLVIFGVFAGIGYHHLVASASDDIARTTCVCVVLVIFGVTGALSTGDNFYRYHPEEQGYSTLSPQQARALSASAAFYKNHGQDITTLWATRIMFRLYGVSTVHRPQIRGQSLFIKSDLVVYRQSWPRHRLHFQRGTETVYVSRLRVSEEWLKRTIATSSIVYSSGPTTIGWGETGRLVGGRCDPQC